MPNIYGEILTVKRIICHCQNFSNIKAHLEIAENLDEAPCLDPGNIKKKILNV